MLGSIRQLRRQWKPIKERLSAEQPEHPTVIRFHRACSWLAAVEDRDTVDPDQVLMYQWIGFNALYGQWDEQQKEPKPDLESCRVFLNRILELDRDHAIRKILEDNKRLVLTILDDVYLAGFFWRDPSKQKAQQTTREKRNASLWYAQGRWALILEQVVMRIYFLRCQLIHGAATVNSRLNRKSLNRCITMLDHLLPAFLQVWIRHGADEDWGPMCYPPV